jgi:hypothetical protein
MLNTVVVATIQVEITVILIPTGQQPVAVVLVVIHMTTVRAVAVVAVAVIQTGRQELVMEVAASVDKVITVVSLLSEEWGQAVAEPVLPEPIVPAFIVHFGVII